MKKIKFLFAGGLLFFASMLNAQNNTNFGTNANPYNYGNNNVSLGEEAGMALLNTIDPNTGLHTVLANVFVGVRAGRYDTSGTDNTFLGYQAGLNNSTGSGNTFLGRSAGNNNISGTNNTYVGLGAGYSATGSFNFYGGQNAGYLNGGSYNVFLGYEAGKGYTSYNGSNNILIGYQAGYYETTNNKLYIGSGTPLIYGDFSTKNLLFNGNLEINANTAGTSGLKFTKLKSTDNTAFTSNGKVLTVNTLGEVVLTTDQLGVGGTANIAAASTNCALTISGNGSTATPYLLGATNLYCSNGTLGSDRTVTMNNKNLIFDTTGSTTGGNVYIGPGSAGGFANSGTYNLYVEGGILTEKVRVSSRSTVNWADYVFGKDYKLMPLTEVEAYVNKASHLPGIPSSAEISKEGIDLAEMQSKQMEKIEELTLYLIEQNKILEKQTAEIEQLKIQLKSLGTKN
jgi:hypothetical protein